LLDIGFQKLDALLQANLVGEGCRILHVPEDVRGIQDRVENLLEEIGALPKVGVVGWLTVFGSFHFCNFKAQIIVVKINQSGR
jgi:hypothetical protein